MRINVRGLAGLLGQPARRLERDTGGGLAFDALYGGARAAGATVPTYGPAERQVAASLSSVLLAAANPARRGLVIVNDGSANLYVAQGAPASTSAYTVRLQPAETMTLGGLPLFAGELFGAWDAASGVARVTETV